MQTAVSRGTLIAVMAVDAFQSVVAIVEVSALIKRLNRLSLELPFGHSNTYKSAGIISRASTILELFPNVRVDPAVAYPRHVRRLQRQEAFRPTLRRYPCGPPTKIVPFRGESTRHIERDLKATGDPDTSKIQRPVEVEYMRLSLKLLRMVEFYVLIEFTEVVVALLYATYLTAMFHLPNRVFYLSLKSITFDQLTETVGHVLEYAALEFISLVMLVVILDRLLGFSTLGLLAFTLRKHAQLAQSQLILWVFFATQLTLEHLGNDYTFQFEWMRHTHQRDDSSRAS